MGGLYTAHESGYFAAAGLDVEIQQLTRSTLASPLLAGRRLDAACLGLNPGLLNAAANGSLVKLVACRGVFAPTSGTRGTIYGHRKAFPDGIQDLTLLRGKRVSISGRANFGEYYLDVLLGTVGLSGDDVQLVFLREPDGVAALMAGKVDAIVASDFEKRPESLSGEIVRGLGVADVMPGFQYAFIAFGPSLLESDHDVGVRFLVAYLKGAADFRDGVTPTFLEGLARTGRMDFERVREESREEFSPNGVIDEQSIEIYSDWAFQKGYCPQRVPAELLIDRTYFEAARPQVAERWPA